LHPSFRQIPNLITVVRIALVVPIALTLIDHRLTMTLLLFAAAGLSDGADGFLAKRFGWRTELGAILDPAADKLLLATVFVTLAVLDAVPPWLTAAVVGRDVVIVGGVMAYRRWIGAMTVRPSVISKLNTLCQLGFILAVIAARQFGFPPPWSVTALGALVFVTVVISGLDYLLTFGRLAYASKRPLRPAPGGGT
jgi:cardiolipin synthase